MKYRNAKTKAKLDKKKISKPSQFAKEPKQAEVPHYWVSYKSHQISIN